MTNLAPPPSSLSRALSSAGAVVVAFELTRRFVVGDLDLWAYVVTAVGVVGWVAVLFVPRRPLAMLYGVYAFVVVAGGITATSTDGVSIALVAVALVSLSRDPRVRIRTAAVYGLVAGALVLVGLLIQPVQQLAVLAMEAGTVVAFLAGQSRRQFLVAQQERVVAREEQAHLALLAERQHIAHDIHDVLAHSLGGLVIQLDAVDALLEAGDTDAAAVRVRDARALASDGLAEARRAVAALRDGSPGVTPDAATELPTDMLAAIDSLVEAHRTLGGQATLEEHGVRRPITVPLNRALVRAVQEGLTNARKHAPGQPVKVKIDWTEHEVRLTIDNPVTTGISNTTGGGNGLVGMRARFAGVPGGSVTSGIESGRFVVRAEGQTA